MLYGLLNVVAVRWFGMYSSCVLWSLCHAWKSDTLSRGDDGGDLGDTSLVLTHDLPAPC